MRLHQVALAAALAASIAGAGTASAQPVGPACDITSRQSQTQVASDIDPATCAALAQSISTGGAQFTVATPAGDPGPLATLICGLTAPRGDGTTLRVEVHDPAGGAESTALCGAFHGAGFALDPPVHWWQICAPGVQTLPNVAGTQTAGIASLLTCQAG